MVIITRIKDLGQREWYIRACIENSSSRSVLMAQIETGLHGWAGRAITNFNHTLTTPHSELAGQIEDPSSIEFS